MFLSWNFSKLWASWTWMSKSLITFGNLSAATAFLNKMLPPLSLFSGTPPEMHGLFLLIVSYSSHRLSSVFYFWMCNFKITYSLQIVPSAWTCLLLLDFIAFLFIVFLRATTSIWFFFIISLFLKLLTFCLCIALLILLYCLSVFLVGHWASLKQLFRILYLTDCKFLFFGVGYWKITIWWFNISWFHVPWSCELLFCIWQDVTSFYWLASGEPYLLLACCGFWSFFRPLLVWMFLISYFPLEGILKFVCFFLILQS